MTAPAYDGTVYFLAGASVPGLHLLRAAAHDLTGVELDRTLTRYCNLACGPQRGLLHIQLRDEVAEWYRHADDPAAHAGTDREWWTQDDFDAEILGLLFRMVEGRPPCSTSLNGNLAGGLGAIHPAADGPRIAGRQFCGDCWNTGTTRLLGEIARAS